MTFKEILDKYGIPNVEGGTHKNVRSGWVGFECPQCSYSDAVKFHAAYNQSTGACFCWVCGKLNLIKTLIELTREPYHVIKELLGDLRRDYSPVFEKPTGKLELPTNLIDLNKLQREYLRSRGFDPDELAKIWGVRGIGLHPRLSWRIFIPVMQRFKPVSWTTRAIFEETIPRYVNARPEQEAVPIKSTLMGWDLVGHSILLTEGPLDAMRIGPGAVCGFGMNITAKQFSLLAQKPIRIICLDNEPDAQRKAKELMRNLSILPGKTILACVESAKDPGSASEKEIRQLRKLLH